VPARSPGGHHPDAIAVTNALETRIETLQAELARLEATATGHRADFERERDRAEKLMVELLRATMEAGAAREDRARLQGELTAMQTRARSWWWRRLAG
jgi:predicted  nucleic acid-binding Zn-ribbon protein